MKKTISVLVTEEMHEEFKGYVERDGRTQAAVLLDLVETYIAEEKYDYEN